MNSTIKRLVKTLIPASSASRIKHLHAFYIQYIGGIQTSLGPHFDDSSFTINVCLQSNSTGGDLIFDDLGLSYSHSNSMGIIHSGVLKHHVSELTEGSRENVIIWVTVDH